MRPTVGSKIRKAPGHWDSYCCGASLRCGNLMEVAVLYFWGKAATEPQEGGGKRETVKHGHLARTGLWGRSQRSNGHG